MQLCSLLTISGESCVDIMDAGYFTEKKTGELTNSPENHLSRGESQNCSAESLEQKTIKIVLIYVKDNILVHNPLKNYRINLAQTQL